MYQRMTGDDVRSLREGLRLTQLDLAAATGVTERTVRRWERSGASPMASRLLASIQFEIENKPDGIDDWP